MVKDAYIRVDGEARRVNPPRETIKWLIICRYGKKSQESNLGLTWEVTSYHLSKEAAEKALKGLLSRNLPSRTFHLAEVFRPIPDKKPLPNR